jgi:hypothetical protein
MTSDRELARWRREQARKLRAAPSAPRTKPKEVPTLISDSMRRCASEGCERVFTKFGRCRRCDRTTVHPLKLDRVRALRGGK